MSEYIGARISLFSRSDIRYIGILHEIDSETSTVALEQVISYGTEGRRGPLGEEIPPSDHVYEYIVFKGSDVQDLTILEPPQAKREQPQVPDDPAIIESGSRPPPAPAPARNQEQNVPPPPQPQPGPSQFANPNPNSNPMSMPYMYPSFPGHRLEHPNVQHAPPGQGFPGIQFGPLPTWYPPPPPAQAFHHMHRPLPNQGAPFHQAVLHQQRQHQHQQHQQHHQAPTPGQAEVAGIMEPKAGPSAQSPHGVQPSAPEPTEPVVKNPTPPAQSAPTPPIDTKPSLATALASAAPPVSQAPQSAVAPALPATSAPVGRDALIAHAVAVPNLGAKRAPAPKEPLQTGSNNTNIEIDETKGQPRAGAANPSLHNATLAATAAVAAAMAKLPPPPGTKTQLGGQQQSQQQPQQQQQQQLGSQQQHQTAVDEVTRKVSDLKTSDGTRQPRGGGGPSTTSFRGGRGRGGHHHHHQPTRKVEVPTTDYDFQSANARFNKQDLVKEAIATGSPMNGPSSDDRAAAASSTAANGGTSDADADADDVPIPGPAPSYNKSTSFFDNISSESKDREDTTVPRPGGREWRGVEHRKNLETFGQSSVDTGYHRGGFRGGGRGRGRGYGGRGRRGGGGGLHHHHHHYRGNHGGHGHGDGRGGSLGGASGSGVSSSGAGGGAGGRYRGDHSHAAGQAPASRAPALAAST
ncbi:MAG: hypothetical protein M1815_005337 [Lichina confinis]|nr:MAG: hypothetical protein M1815_005337 [Lichina confinis]